ncbi:MAG: response regulator transcription factor [Proteocatella sp.]
MTFNMNEAAESIILVVDDDKEIANSVAKILEKEGYICKIANDGLSALEIVAQEHIDLILLDIMMPRLDGLSATMKIREKKNIPIIILSAKTEDSDKILGLSMGADDYISKPYNSMELVARVKAQLRRYLYLGSARTTMDEKDNMVVVGGLELDRNSKLVVVDGKEEKLTATEYKILKLLMENPGRVFSAEEIYERVWKEEAYAVENTVMVHIRRIREKIEINTKEPKYLKVVWGIGYKIENKFI